MVRHPDYWPAMTAEVGRIWEPEEILTNFLDEPYFTKRTGWHYSTAGYILRKLNYPLAPLVLALVLGDRAEDSFRQSMLMSQGDMSILFSNSLVGGLTTLALILLFWPVLSVVIKRIKGG